MRRNAAPGPGPPWCAVHGPADGRGNEQVWRDGGRQARRARLLKAVLVVPLDEELGRRSGVLMGRAKKADVVDAAVVLLAADGDSILTSDPGDLADLAAAAGVHVDLVPV